MEFLADTNLQQSAEMSRNKNACMSKHTIFGQILSDIKKKNSSHLDLLVFDESFVPICQVTGVGKFVSQLLGVAVDDGGDSVDLLPCLNTQLILRFVGLTVWGLCEHTQN